MSSASSIQLRELVENVEDHLRSIARIELDNRDADYIIEKLSDIVQGRKRNWWLPKDRFQALENWFKVDGVFLLKNSLSPGKLPIIIKELESLKGFTKARWYLESNAQNSELKALLEKNLRLAQQYIRDAANKLGLEYTPLGLVKPSTSKPSRDKRDTFGDKKRQEYLQWLDYQIEVIRNFYEPHFTLSEILENELKNYKEKSDPREKLFIINMLNYCQANSIELSQYICESATRFKSKSEIILQD
ncbi:MAG: hypothetical protein GF315_00500 [candidate division Zixibacteria bacterium]|nr:hypothetical protein [candidate division Zixibacteria bacterium]